MYFENCGCLKGKLAFFTGHEIKEGIPLLGMPSGKTHTFYIYRMYRMYKKTGIDRQATGKCGILSA
ncbi:hypothetical protein SDC9_84654 [bioreactor metagenome]|uniref:Uncharacterized protein n=1 Tax=bioreactor metagenome TaxID=1076179 RepID=A0A644ZDR3_9ZZZZ